MMNQELLKKYSIPVPRYTSYPPANFFHENFSAEDFKKKVISSNQEEPNHISFYIHIPYCYQICNYCGCNATPLKNKSQIGIYVEALKKEIQMVLPLLDKNRKITQIHYGGGTPTILPVETLKEINDILTSNFSYIENPEVAIECHPGYMDEAYCEELIAAGFNRISLGVQDFSSDVLKIANRKAPRKPIKNFIEIFKANNIPVNMDFIYGLPKQTPESFRESLHEAIQLKPNRIVTFSYAHVPWVNERQYIFEKIGLPDSTEKDKIYQIAKEELLKHNYLPIGLDHFVLANDELYLAKKEGKLHRNFQGYCTKKTTGQVYAFGVTGISQLTTTYSQNIKDINQYIQSINKNNFPVAKGYILNKEEQITKEVIAQLMCNYTIKWEDLAHDLKIDVSEIKNSINYNLKELNQFAEDGIITFDEKHLTVLEENAYFVRNVAAALDKKFVLGENKYSKSV